MRLKWRQKVFGGFLALLAVAQLSVINSQTPQLVVQTANDYLISTVTFSQDSQFILTGDHVGTLVLWDIKGNQLRRFAEEKAIESVAISSDNRVIAMLTGGQLVVQPLTSIRQPARYSFRDIVFDSVAISPAGDLFLIGGQSEKGSMGRKCILWERRTKKILREFENCVSGAFSPDNRTLVAWYKIGDYNRGILRAWSLKDQQMKWETPELKSSYQFDTDVRLTFSIDGKKIIKGYGSSGSYLPLDAESGKLLAAEELEPGYKDETNIGLMDKYAVSPDETLLLVNIDLGAGGSQGAFNNSFKLYEYATGKLLRRLERGPRIAQIVRTSNLTSNRLLIADRIGDAYLWDLADGKEIRRFVRPTNIDSFPIDPDNPVHETEEEDTGQNALPTAAISFDGRYVATTPFGGLGEETFLWSADTGELIQRFEEEAQSLGIVKSPLNILIQQCRAIKLVDPASTSALWTASTDDNCGGNADLRVERDLARLSQDGTLVLAGNHSNDAALLDAKTGEIKKLFPGMAGDPVALSPDNQVAATTRWEPTVRDEGRWTTILFSTRTKNILAKLSNRADAMTFSPNGSIFFLLSGRSVIKISVPTGKELGRLVIDDAVVNDIAISPDGNFLIAATFDGSARFFDIAKFKEVSRVFSLRDGNWVVVAPDGRFDTNDVENIKGLVWVAPYEPLVALPLEIFSRHYFEPELLARVLKCNAASETGKADPCEKEFRPLPSIGEINRIQPKAKVGVRK